ncbi:erythromycin esterase family protein [Lacinutrix jangbogonensis]|uniref:erythromycin esterase family protein n=1 Tax=Lacinutrix jangbogonensis TaxID=1469557 RepID=UPI00053D0B69|nr:erythromycin esterase family protein [Lacinutrix jangbogonensis]
MKTFKLIVLFGIITFSSCAQESKSPEAWLKNKTIELEPNGNYDFTEIGKAIGNKRIVALGESSHGLGKYYELKAALVEYLYKEKGFEVLAMEGGLGDINMAYSNIDTLSVAQLRDHTVFGNFRAAEVTPMFTLIKSASASKKPLHYTGYDTQASSGYVQELLTKIIKPYDKELSDSLQTRLWSYGRAYQAGKEGDSIAYEKHRNLFINTSAHAKRILVNNSDEIKKNFDVSDFQFQISQRTLEMFQKSTQLTYEDRYEDNALRDELMYENLQWIMTVLFPDKKIIIWAHNAHIENANAQNHTVKWMGHYLKDAYKDNYYALGLFTYKGNTYQHWTKKTIPFENNDNYFLEKKMMDTGKKVAFLNLETVNESKNSEWIFNQTHGYELENGGNISFIPKKRFDGLITVYKSEIPTYGK